MGDKEEENKERKELYKKGKRQRGNKEMREVYQIFQRHQHQRLNVSLRKILKTINVVKVKSPHNLCKDIYRVTSRFKSLPTTFRIKDKVFDFHSTKTSQNFFSKHAKF